MAMIICNECGKEVSDKASTCPNCGCPIAQGQPGNYAPPADDGKGKKKKKKKTGSIIAIVIICLLMLGFCSSDGDEDSSSSSSTSTSTTASSEKKETETTKETTKKTEAPKETEKKEEPKKEYKKVTAKKLEDDLEGNALKAADTYMDQYLEITGIITSVDISGKYIGINSEEYVFTNIQCYIMNDDQKKVVMDKNKGDSVTIKGKVTNIGEVLGYSIEMDEIK